MKKTTKKKSLVMSKREFDKLINPKPAKKLAPLLEIKQREGSEEKIMVGANTILTIDGVPVRGATGVKFEVNAKGVAKALITVVGRFQVVGRPLTKTIKLYK